MAKSKYIEALEEQYTKKDAKSVLRYKAPDNKWRYVQTSKDASGGNMPSGGGMTEVTWQELKDKRDNGQLIAGSLYRITDYQCTTTQENTQSAGHQFDIVLLALSENKLAEEGWAMMNESNVYDVTFADGVTLKCYLYFFDDETDCNIVLVADTSIGRNLGVGKEDLYVDGSIDEENKTLFREGFTSNEFLTDGEPLPYNYFQNSNLSAWKVWYCLDNDKSRFAWADDSLDEDVSTSFITVSNDSSIIYYYKNPVVGEGKYLWESSDDAGVFTDSETPGNGDTVYVYQKRTGYKTIGTVTSYIAAHEGTNLPNGRGVIYRLIDEWGNDVPYDFKNIQFVRKLTDGEYDDSTGTDTWVYTFSDGFVDSSIPQLDGEGGFQVSSKRNYIGQNEDRTLNDIVTIVCSDCEFKVSSLITLSYCNRLVLSACGGDDSIFSFESDAIYIGNKKVLTEE